MEKKLPDKVMRIERFLSKNQVIAAIIVFIDLFLFAVINYFLNIFNNIPDWVRDLDHPLKYLGLGNCLPDWNFVSSYTSTYLVIFIGYVIACVVIDIMFAMKMKIAFDEKGVNLNQKGDQRFAYNEEIKQQYKEIDDRDTPFSGMGGMIISRMENKLYIDPTPTNNLLIGITRAGKDQMYVIPSLDVYSRAEIKMSMAVNDPKLEGYKSSKKTLEKRGYDVYLLNFANPLHSMGYNPLDMIKEAWLSGDIPGAELLAQTYAFTIFNPDKPQCNDKFWDSADASVLNALIIAHIEDMVKADELVNEQNMIIHKEKQTAYKKLSDEKRQEADSIFYQAIGEGKSIYRDTAIKYIPENFEFVPTDENIRNLNMNTIIYTFTELVRIKDENNADITALDLYFSRRPGLNRAKLRYAGAEVAGDRTKGSIFATMLEKLLVFTSENVAKMTAESSFKLDDIGYGEKPIAVFMSVPDYDKSIHFLSTVFVRQLNFVLSKRATNSKTGRVPRHVKFILNEAGNMPAIENMEGQITVSLGRNMSYDIYIQDYQQLYDHYDNNAKTIINNCGNQIYIMANNSDTAKEFSKDLGNETIIETQRSGERLSIHKHFVEHPSEKPLLNENQLMELKLGETVVRRTMKRTDLDGSKIRPRPIFNSIESGKSLLFSYEYLTDTFPNPDTIDPMELINEDRSHINLEERLWDPMMSFNLIEMAEREYRKQHREIKVNFGTGNLSNTNVNKKQSKKKEVVENTVKKKLGTLKDLSNKDEVLEIAAKMLNTSIKDSIKIDDFIKEINDSDINETNKEALICLIRMGTK